VPTCHIPISAVRRLLIPAVALIAQEQMSIVVQRLTLAPVMWVMLAATAVAVWARDMSAVMTAKAAVRRARLVPLVVVSDSQARLPLQAQPQARLLPRSPAQARLLRRNPAQAQLPLHAQVQAQAQPRAVAFPAAAAAAAAAAVLLLPRVLTVKVAQPQLLDRQRVSLPRDFIVPYADHYLLASPTPVGGLVDASSTMLAPAATSVVPAMSGAGRIPGSAVLICILSAIAVAMVS